MTKDRYKVSLTFYTEIDEFDALIVEERLSECVAGWFGHLPSSVAVDRERV